jgi:hypothetical protein
MARSSNEVWLHVGELEEPAREGGRLAKGRALAEKAMSKATMIPASVSAGFFIIRLKAAFGFGFRCVAYNRLT